MDRDAVVVGAGPAGCAAAILLARGGLRVMLLEKSAASPPKVCGEYLSPGCLPILDRLGVRASLEERGARPLVGMRIHGPDGAGPVDAFYPPLAGPSRAPAWGLSVRREVLDPLLLDLARECGAEFVPGFQASDLLCDGGAVRGVEGRLNGRLERLSARFVVGADGRASVVARRLGEVRRHLRLDKMARVGYFTGIERPEDLGEIFVGAGAYAILNPVGPGLTNIGLVADRLVVDRGAGAAVGDPGRFLSDAAAVHCALPARLASAVAAAPVRALGPLAVRARRLGAFGALLAGDAAGFLDPFTGEGLYGALRSAEIAASVALATLRRTPPTASPDLRGYQRAWEREFLPKWRLCELLQGAIRRPRVSRWIVERLRWRPRAASRLLAAAGDMVPPNGLGPFPLLRLTASLLIGGR